MLNKRIDDNKRAKVVGGALLAALIIGVVAFPFANQVILDMYHDGEARETEQNLAGGCERATREHATSQYDWQLWTCNNGPQIKQLVHKTWR